MNDSQSIAAAAAAFAVTLLLYGFTSLPGPGWHDSAELSLRALQLGATHAPGAPLHTLLGHFMTLFGLSPAAATTWLSVICAAGAASVAAWLLAQWANNSLIAVAGALMFALLFPIWGVAIKTELYALSLLLVALAIYFSWCWQRNQEPAASSLLPLVIVLGLSLGAHLANGLLLPAFALFVALQSRSARTTVSFCAALALCIALVALANVLLAGNVPPFGRYVPDTLPGIYMYMSGAEYELPQAKEPGFAYQRVFEHGMIFGKNFLYVGLLPMLLGAARMFRRAPNFAWLLLLSWLSYLGYFTLFGSGDYFVMVAPAYLIGSLWVVLGVVDLAEHLSQPWRVAAAAAPLGLLAAIAVFQQFDMRRTNAAAQDVQEYQRHAFETFPQNALVVARWNEFTALRYAQVVEGKRPDVRLLLPARSERHYSYGAVSDYMYFVDSALCEQPVVTNRLDADVMGRYRVEQLDTSGVWARFQPIDTTQCATIDNGGR